MALPTFTASQVMDLSAALNNDAGKSAFTYNAQLPYLQMAYGEFGKILRANNVPITNACALPVVVTTAMTDIGGSTGPALPSDLVEIQKLSERDNGAIEDYLEMKRVEFLPTIVEKTQELIYWTWQNQIIKFIGALSNRQVLIEYVSNSIGSIVDQTTVIGILDSKELLAYRTAALSALYIGEDKERSDQLNADASNALDTYMMVVTKGRQVMPVRRRPFMSSYKSRGLW